MAIRRDRGPVEKTRRRRAFARRLAGAIALTVALQAQAPAAAQPPGLRVQKLTPAGQAFSDLSLEPTNRPAISPDGKWVAYWFDGDTDEVHDLYIASRFGGDVRRVSATRPSGSLDVELTRCAWSADGRRLLFLLDQQTPLREELWSVPADGLPVDAVQLSGAIDPAARVFWFLDAGDGLSVAFGSNLGGRDEIWSAPLDGGLPAIRLDGAPAGDITFGQAAAAGGLLVYRQQPQGQAMQLWSVPADGSAAPTRLNGDLVANGNVSAMRITPDGTRVVYRADQRFNDVEELWSVPIGGPAAAATRLSPTLPAFGDVRSNWQLSSDGGRVLFYADSGVDEQLELWSVPVAGPATAAVHLNVALVAGGDVYSYSTLDDLVVYVADNALDEQYQAWAVPIAGPFTAGVRLHGNLAADVDVAIAAIVPATPEPLVLLGGDLRANDKFDFFTQRADGVGAPHPLFANVPAGFGYQPGCGGGGPPDGSAVVLCADLAAADKVELFRLDLDLVSTEDRLSSAVTIATGDVTRLAVSPDGRWTAYRADEGVDERFDLLRVPTGGAAPQRIHAAPASSALDVADGDGFQFTPDGAGIVYAADHETNEAMDLWISDAMIFRADFAAGDAGEWSSVTP